MLSLQSLVQLHSMVTSHVRPTIMVASSTEANAIAAKNHLTLAQLLQPFGAGLHSNPGMQGVLSSFLPFPCLFFLHPVFVCRQHFHFSRSSSAAQSETLAFV
jgi:hypothetical protein